MPIELSKVRKHNPLLGVCLCVIFKMERPPKCFLHGVVNFVLTSTKEPQLNGKGLARDSWLLQIRRETGRDNCVAGAAGRGWTHRIEGEIS